MTPEKKEKRKVAAKFYAKNFRERKRKLLEDTLKENEELKDQIGFLKLEIEMLLGLLV